METQGGCDASEKRVQAEVRQGGKQERGERDAAGEARHFAFGERRQGREGHKPQAGDCDRPFGSAQEGREGSSKKVQLGNPVKFDPAATRSGAEIVGLPIADQLLDRLAFAEIFREDFARELGEFGVAGKSESD